MDACANPSLFALLALASDSDFGTVEAHRRNGGNFNDVPFGIALLDIPTVLLVHGTVMVHTAFGLLIGLNRGVATR